ncbi:MAG: polysaccharide deacetylase family protein [Pseudomonadota bacterium]
MYASLLYAADYRVLSESDSHLVVLADARLSDEDLAQRFLGRAEYDWRIKEANPPSDNPRRVVVIPKRWFNPGGVHQRTQQVVPILAYHRFGPRPSRMMVTPESFREQLVYLRDNNFRVVSLSEFQRYLQGEAGLPSKAVVLTIDDGYQSAYRVAFPLLKEFGYPCTVFIYSDFMNRGGLKTRQMEEMLDSGLIEIQSHSKSHANLTRRVDGESGDEYMRRVRQEVVEPKQRLERVLGGNDVFAFAYPYGATDQQVVREIVASEHALSVTVTQGVNNFASHPHLLRRTMVFGGWNMERFARALRTETTWR